MSDWVDVALRREIDPGQHKTVVVDDTPIAVFNVAGEYYAIEDSCTHDGSPLASGCIEGTEIECPHHGARFSLVTGDVLSPPAYEPVAVFPLRIHQGVIQVRDPRDD